MESRARQGISPINTLKGPATSHGPAASGPGAKQGCDLPSANLAWIAFLSGRTPQTHERIGERVAAQRSAGMGSPEAGDRENGVGPARDARRNRARQPCKRPSPRQDRFRGRTCAVGIGPQTGAKPRSRCQLIPDRPPFSFHLSPKRRPITPTKINRGGRDGTNDTWARSDRNVAKQLAAVQSTA